MNHSPLRAAVALIAALALPAAPALAQTPVPNSPQELLDAWVGLWKSYDLDLVAELFLQDDRLTYFSSEREGILQGFESIVEHHRGFGFVPGGSSREQFIWVEEVRIAEFGDNALIAAIWYFGDPAAPADAQRGPMSVLAVHTTDGYRIAHMNFATYRAD